MGVYSENHRGKYEEGKYHGVDNMGYKEIFAESNEAVKERYELIIERIASICKEESVSEKYRDYFQKAAHYICLTDEILRKEEAGELEHRSLQECRR